MPADVIQLAGDAVRPLLEHASREMGLHHADAQKAKVQLAEFERAHSGPGTPEAMLARHLAVAGLDGLSAVVVGPVPLRRHSEA